MDSEESYTTAKRTTRVKSIFDSDDSEEERDDCISSIIETESVQQFVRSPASPICDKEKEPPVTFSSSEESTLDSEILRRAGNMEESEPSLDDGASIKEYAAKHTEDPLPLSEDLSNQKQLNESDSASGISCDNINDEYALNVGSDDVESNQQEETAYKVGADAKKYDQEEVEPCQPGSNENAVSSATLGESPCHEEDEDQLIADKPSNETDSKLIADLLVSSEDDDDDDLLREEQNLRAEIEGALDVVNRESKTERDNESQNESPECMSGHSSALHTIHVDLNTAKSTSAEEMPSVHSELIPVGNLCEERITKEMNEDTDQNTIHKSFIGDTNVSNDNFQNVVDENLGEELLQDSGDSLNDEINSSNDHLIKKGDEESSISGDEQAITRDVYASSNDEEALYSSSPHLDENDHQSIHSSEKVHCNIPDKIDYTENVESSQESGDATEELKSDSEHLSGADTSFNRESLAIDEHSEKETSSVNLFSVASLPEALRPMECSGSEKYDDPAVSEQQHADLETLNSEKPDLRDSEDARNEIDKMEGIDGSVSIPVITSPEFEKITKINDKVKEVTDMRVNSPSIEFLPSSPVKSPIIKYSIIKKKARSINMPEIMVAFEKGWRREIVFRSTSGNSNRADVYYKSPCGKKQRSRVQVETFLLNNGITDLSLDNFTFLREPLGVDSAYEKIRHATAKIVPKVASDGASDEIKLKKKIIRMEKTNLNESSNIQPAKRTKTEQKQSEPVKVNVSAAKTHFARKVSQANSRSAVYATHLFTPNPPLMQPKIITPLISKGLRDKTFLCTAVCPAGGGRVPSLQCVKCLCLFHSECCFMPSGAISIVCSALAKFLCPNCYREESEVSLTASVNPIKTYEPLSYDPPSDSEDEGLCMDVDGSPKREVNLRPLTPPIQHQRSSQFCSPHPQQCPTPDINAIGSPNITQPTAILRQNIGPLGQPMILPRPLALQNNSGAVPGPQQQYFLILNQGTEQVPICLPSSFSGNFGLPSDPAKSIAMLPPGMNASNQLEVAPPMAEGEKRITSSANQARLPQALPVVRGATHLFEDMAKLYHVVKRVFSYLSVPDLLIASRVCVMWRDMALNPCYWRTVRLRNVCVKDWTMFVGFLKRRGTTELDLRKMVIHASLEDLDEKIAAIEQDEEVNKETDNEEQSNQEEVEQLPETVFADKEFSPSANEEMDVMQPSSDISVTEKEEVNKSVEEQLEELPDFNSRPSLSEPIIEDVGSDDLSCETPKETLVTFDKIDEVISDPVDVSDKASSVHSEEVDVPCSPEVAESDSEKEVPVDFKEENTAASALDTAFDALAQQTAEEQESYKKYLYTKQVASSVLNEHDYFGKILVESSSSSSSDNSSDSDSDTTEVAKNATLQQSKCGQDVHQSLKDEMMAVMNVDIPLTAGERDSYEDSTDMQLEPPPSKKRKLCSKSPPQTSKPIKKLKDSNLKSDNVSLKCQSPPLAEAARQSPISPIQIQESFSQVQDDADIIQSKPIMLSQLPKTEERATEEPMLVSTVSPKSPPRMSAITPKTFCPPPQIQNKIPKKDASNRDWHIIGSALKNLCSLQKILVGSCSPDVVEILIYYCQQLTHFTAPNLNSKFGSDPASLDPSYLMQSRHLEELRLASQKSFLLKSNFNFIKLQNLKILMLKGLKTSSFGWPYLGTNLTHLYLSSIATFSTNNWKNLATMTNLITLELEGSGCDHDLDFPATLSSLQQLKFLSLFDWHVGPKFTNAIKRAHNIKHLHIIPAAESQALRGVYAGRIFTTLESAKHLQQLIWGFLPANVVTSEEDQKDKIFLLSKKATRDSSAAKEEVPTELSFDTLETFIRYKVPSMKVCVRKVSAVSWAWSTDSEWR